MRRFLAHPARAVTGGFLVPLVLGIVCLMLPVSRAPGSPADLLVAAFTTVSAVCVTGLVTVDTASYWSPFGHVVILGLIQVGGLGVMTLATLLALAVRGRLGLRTSLAAQVDSHSPDLGQVRRVVVRVLRLALVVEAAVALVLTLAFALRHDMGWGRAAWHGVFHAVSAFNNAGFALYPDNLVPFVTDAWVIGPVCVAVVVGGLGLPVVRELLRGRPPSRWTVHTRLTLGGTAVLLLVGVAAFWVFEGGPGGTLGGMTWREQAVGALGGGVFPRTAGFNSVDYRQVSEETWDATLAESALRTRHGVTVVGLKRAGEPFTYAVPETVVRRGDELVISGLIPVVERFTALAPGRARRHPGPRGGRPSR